MKVKNYIVFLLASIAIMLVSAPYGLAQCAMCRATVENNVSAGEAGMASGLNFGILYLFAAPYLVVMVIAYFWYKSSKANAKKVRSSSRYTG